MNLKSAAVGLFKIFIKFLSYEKGIYEMTFHDLFKKMDKIVFWTNCMDFENSVAQNPVLRNRPLTFIDFVHKFRIWSFKIWVQF